METDGVKILDKLASNLPLRKEAHNFKVVPPEFFLALFATNIGIVLKLPKFLTIGFLVVMLVLLMLHLYKYKTLKDVARKAPVTARSASYSWPVPFDAEASLKKISSFVVSGFGNDDKVWGWVSLHDVKDDVFPSTGKRGEVYQRAMKRMGYYNTLFPVFLFGGILFIFASLITMTVSMRIDFLSALPPWVFLCGIVAGISLALLAPISSVMSNSYFKLAPRLRHSAARRLNYLAKKAPHIPVPASFVEIKEETRQVSGTPFP